jgi:hypothetical protein
VCCQHTLGYGVGFGHKRLSTEKSTSLDTPAGIWGQRPIVQAVHEVLRVWPLGEFVATLVFFLTSPERLSMRGDSFFLTAGHGRDFGDSYGPAPRVLGETLCAFGRTGQ